MTNGTSKLLAAQLRTGTAACVLVLASIAWAQGPGSVLEPVRSESPLRPDEILQRALDRTAKKEEAGLELLFESVVDSVVETLDAEGRVTEVETKRSRRYPLEGYLYEELVAVAGKPLSSEQASKERRRKANFVREARRQAAKGQRLESDRRRMRFNNELMDRYRTVMIGTAEMSGHDCWVLRFEPRQGDLPSTGSMDRALNQSSGRLWVKKSNFQVVRTSFSMDSPVRMLWGFLATLRRADGQIDFAPVQGDLWFPSRFQIELDLQLLMGVKAIRRRIRNEWTNYRPLEKPATPEVSGGG